VSPCYYYYRNSRVLFYRIISDEQRLVITQHRAEALRLYGVLNLLNEIFFLMFFWMIVKSTFIICVHHIWIVIAFSLCPRKYFKGKFCVSFLNSISAAIASCVTSLFVLLSSARFADSVDTNYGVSSF